jgi:putative sigma-54 modulation protein
MQVIVSARGMTISRTYKDALSRKLAKIEPLLPAIIETKAVLSKEKHRRTAALTVIAKHHTFRSEETAEDLAVAVDMAVDALARQVREMKDRVTSRKARHRRRPAPALPGRETPAAAPTPGVRVRRMPVKAMSVEDAAAEVRAGRDDFLVFLDAATEAVSVLYRRPDGGLELIQPVP